MSQSRQCLDKEAVTVAIALVAIALVVISRAMLRSDTF